MVIADISVASQLGSRSFSDYLINRFILETIHLKTCDLNNVYLMYINYPYGVIILLNNNIIYNQLCHVSLIRHYNH